jgi:hypothetical protein
MDIPGAPPFGRVHFVHQNAMVEEAGVQASHIDHDALVVQMLEEGRDGCFGSDVDFDRYGACAEAFDLGSYSLELIHGA